MSGKGGVGKTTIAVNLSYSLSLKGYSVGILDVDIHGPNVLKMLGHDNVRFKVKKEKLIPFMINPKLKVVSIAGYIPDASAVIWRGPMKHNIIKQLFENTEWGELDYLIVDFPPGTGDEHISTTQLLPDIKGAIIVSTPQKVSIMDMNRSIDFCNQMNIPILGIIENMSGGLFGSNTVQIECKNKNLNFLGKIKLSKEIIDSSEKGIPFIKGNDIILTKKFNEMTMKLLEEKK